MITVNFSDTHESEEDTNELVQMSLRNIRGSARQKRLERNSQHNFNGNIFKAKTPQREAKRPIKKEPPVQDQTEKDLSVLDILSQKRKQSREKMK